MKIKHLINFRPALCCALLLATLNIAAENVLLTEENFSAGMITFLKSKNMYKSYIHTNADGVEYIEADKINGTMSLDHAAITDSRGIRNFVNVTRVETKSATNLTHLDVRGMPNLTYIQLAKQEGTSVQGTTNESLKINTVLADSTKITTINLQRCLNLKHVSLKGCTELTSVYLNGCDIMGLDLSSSSGITIIQVKDNPHMSVLRLPKSAPKLTQIHCCHTNLTELILPEDMANDVAGDRKIYTINIDATQVKHIKMPVYDPDRGLRLPWVQSLTLGEGALISANVGRLARAVNGSWTIRTKGTQARLGHVSSFEVFPSDEQVMTGTSAMGFAPAGSYDSNTHVYTFDEGVKTVKYTASSYAATSNYGKVTFGNGPLASINVTVTRLLDAPQIYLEFDDENATLDQLYAKYMGEDIVEKKNDDGTIKYVRIPLTYLGDNVYELRPKCLLGNFHFVLVDEDYPDGLILGGNDADVTQLEACDASVIAEKNGYVFLDCKMAGAQRSGNGFESTFSLHKWQPREKKTNDVHKGSNDYFAESHPHEFTTHFNEQQGRVGRIENPVLTLHYIKDDPSSYLTVSAPGGVSGIDEILPDHIPGFEGEDYDANAPVMYYDMQGRRIDNPSAGLYIRRQGTRADKVLLR